MTVCELYQPLFEDHIKEVVESSGRSSAKTTSNDIAALTTMLQGEKNNVWYCMGEKSDIRDKIFSLFFKKASDISPMPFR